MVVGRRGGRGIGSRRVLGNFGRLDSAGRGKKNKALNKVRRGRRGRVFRGKKGSGTCHPGKEMRGRGRKIVKTDVQIR